MTRAAAWALVVALLICAVAGLWIGSELHYGNCLAAHRPLSGDPAVEAFGAEPATGKDSCSRWPF